MDKIIPHHLRQGTKEYQFTKKHFLVCEFGDAWMNAHWSKTESDYLIHGRENVRKFFDELSDDTLVFTITHWQTVLNSMGASNFVRDEGIAGRDASLIYVTYHFKKITIKYAGKWMRSGNMAHVITDLYQLTDLLDSLGITLKHSTGSIGLEVLKFVMTERYELHTPRRAARVYKAARIEEKPVYYTMVNGVDWDIVGAYAWAMTTRPLPTAFDSADHKRIGDTGDGIALAYIKPREINLDFAYSPIPTGYYKNQRTRWGNEPVLGFFTYDDIRIAGDYGASIKIVENWPAVEYISERDTEGMQWMFRLLRKWPHGKKIVNSIWGMMIVNPGGALYRHIDDDNRNKTTFLGKKPTKRYRRIIASYGMGAVVAARIRSKLYDELLSKTAVILCHTDGAVVHDTTSRFNRDKIFSDSAFQPRGPIGESLGDWKYIGRHRNLYMATAQHYTYLNEYGEREYRWAGADIPIDWKGEIDKQRESGHSSYDAIRAMFRYRPDNWADRWVMETERP